MKNQKKCHIAGRRWRAGLVMMAVAFVAACGGGGGGGDVVATPEVPALDPTILTGRFFDSATGGVDYVTETLSGTTDSEGRFNYRAGETVRFAIGGQPLGKANAASLVHVYDVTAPGFAAPTAYSSLRIAQVLQSLDADADPSNGISILSAAKTWFAKAVLDFTAKPINFAAAFNTAAATGARSLKSEAQAQAHLDSGILAVTPSYATACGVPTQVVVLESLADNNRTTIDTAQGFFTCDDRAQILAFKYNVQPWMRSELTVLNDQAAVFVDLTENTQYVVDEAKRNSIVGKTLMLTDGMIDRADELSDLLTDKNKKVVAVKAAAAVARAAFGVVDVLYKPANARNAEEAELAYGLAKAVVDEMVSSAECAVVRESKRRNDACTAAILRLFKVLDKSLNLATVDNVAANTALQWLGEVMTLAEALAKDSTNRVKARTALMSFAVDFIKTTANLVVVANTTDGSAARAIWKDGIDTVATVISSGIACKDVLAPPTISSIKVCKDKAINEGIVDPIIRSAFNVQMLWDLTKIDRQTQSLLLADRLSRDYLAAGGDLVRWYATYGLVDQETSHFCWNLLALCADDQLTHERVMFDRVLATLKEKGPWWVGVPADATWQRFNAVRAQVRQLAKYYQGEQVLQVTATADIGNKSVALSVVGQSPTIDTIQCTAAGATPERVDFSTGKGGTATLTYPTYMPGSVTCIGRKGTADVVRRSAAWSLATCGVDEALTQGQCSRLIGGAKVVKSFAEEFNSTVLNTLVWTAMKPVQGASITMAGSTFQASYFGFLWTKDKVVFSGQKIVVEGRAWGPGNRRSTTFTLYDAAQAGDAIGFGDTTYGGWGFHANGSGSFNFVEVERPSGVGPAPQNCTALGGSTSAPMEYRMTLVGNSIKFERGPTLANITQSATRTLGRNITGRAFYLVVGAGDNVFSPAHYDWVRVAVD